ncbi:hypothetical protein KCU90_g9893, partial [Aureobasidium melanogenum]
METSLGAVSRVRSFATTTEQEAKSETSTTSQDLVTKGAVVFSGVHAKYTDAPGPYDLNDITFSIPSDLTSALSKVRLLDLVNDRGGLDADIDQQSLSQGQAQLLCLARTLLRKSKLVILDEATSSLDAETDAVVRDVLRSEFVDCTVISVAHRTTTILEADMVIMMDAGHVSAIGKPDELSISDDRFRQLCGIS